jgi:hypothetical protein
MVAAYGCIIATLWDGIQAQAHQKELNSKYHFSDLFFN